MADTKISGLPASTTPLAGTEVLPIVQSSSTVQVSVANLTAGRAVATGALTVTGAATVSTTLGVTGVSTLTAGAVIQGLTVGLGGGAVSTNTAVGGVALPVNNTGANNTAVGYAALNGNTSGGNNTAVGRQALDANISGTDSSAFGYLALASATGSSNTAMGGQALRFNTTASNNTAVGYQAGYNANGPSSIIAVGYQAGYTGILRGLTIGAEAGRSASGDDNICIGFQAGYYTTATTTGTSNIFLGQYCRGSGATISGEYVLGYNLAGKGANTFYVGGASGAYNGANVTTWATTSDQRIKKNIVDVSNGLSVITALRPVEFDYKENDKHEVGFIAQEYQQVLPDQIIQHAATEAEKKWVDEDGKVFGIQQNLVPYLVKAIQEQQAIITALTSRITALENK